MPKTVSRTREILTIFSLAMAFRALFGDEISAFINGMYLGFTDGI